MASCGSAGALALDEVGDRGLAQHLLERLLGLEPDGRRTALLDALTLALGADGRRHEPVERLDHLEDGDLGRRAGEDEAAARAAAAVHDAGPAQRREELLEELQRDAAGGGDVGQPDEAVGPRLGALGELDQGSDGVLALG